jgi:hypothetical protein
MSCDWAPAIGRQSAVASTAAAMVVVRASIEDLRDQMV